MKVNANTLLNYIRCRRYAALNDPDTEYQSQNFDVSSHNYYKAYVDLFKDVFFGKHKVEKNIQLSFDFHKEIQLNETYHYKSGNSIYCLIPSTSKDFLKLTYKYGSERMPVFGENNKGIYEINDLESEEINNNYFDKLKKLTTRTDDLGRIVYTYGFKQFLYNEINLRNKDKVYIVMLNSDYVYNGKLYEKSMFHILDFSKIYSEFLDIIESDLFRMINHIELNDFTPCKLVKKECNKGDAFECKFVDFCFSHLPKNHSILSYFNNYRGFEEMTDEGIITHDTYNLINEGYVDILDVPISWLKDEKHLMQRYCVESNYKHVNKEKIQAILSSLTYPLVYLDFEALPCLLPRYKGETPFTQSVFQYSIHVELVENKLDKDGAKHYEFIADPTVDTRRELVKNLIHIVNSYNSSVIVYHKTFEQMRLREFQVIFPEYKIELQKIIDRLFDLKDVLKTNRRFYQKLGFSDELSYHYNFYDKKLSGSYSLKKVIKVFNKSAYKNLAIKNGVEAYKAYMSLEYLQPAERDVIINNLLEYCKQDTYSMFEIIQGLKGFLDDDFRIT